MGFVNFKKKIDSLSEWIGQMSKWIVFALVIIVSFDVIMRYVFNKPTIWAHPLSYMLGAAIYALGQCYSRKERANVNVDIFYERFSEKTQLVLDTIFDVILFIPTFSFLTVKMWEKFFNALRIHETDISSTWYAPLWPVRLMIAVGFSLLLLQFLVDFIEQLLMLCRGSED